MYTSQHKSVFSTNTSNGKAILRSHYIGPHPILHYYLQRMNLKGIVSGSLGTGTRSDAGDSLTHAEAMEVLIHNIVVCPVPLYRLSEWIEPVEADALGLNEEKKKAVNDDRIARTLEALAGRRGRSLFFRLALRILKEFSLGTDRMHFDTTTVTFCGEYASSKAEPEIRHGHKKDHRPDLKQLVFGLNVTSDGAVPLLHHIYSGNRTDDTVHTGNIESLRHLLGREDFIYVADSKLATRLNLRLIDRSGGRFVTVLPRTRKEDKEFRQRLRTSKVRWYFLLKIPSRRRFHDPPDVFCTCKADVETTDDGYRLIWIRSSRKAELDKAARDNSIEKAFTALEDLSAKLNLGKFKKKSIIRKAVNSILQSHDVKRFIEVKIAFRTEEQSKFLCKGRPKADAPVRIIRKRFYYLKIQKQQKNLRDEAKTDGVFPIVTNLDKSYGKRELLRIYKYQPYVEKRFSALKSELRVAPVFIKKPARVAGMLHVYFIAIALTSLIERTVRKNMQLKAIKNLPLLPEKRPAGAPTSARILEPFTGLTWFEFQQMENIVTFPLRLDKLQKDLLSLLEVPLEVYR